MATINSQGLVNDGGPNLTVAGNTTCAGLTTTNANAMSANVLLGSGSITILQPGFFQIPVTGSAGSGQFTGSLPSPLAFPGGEILITDTAGIYPYLITGSMAIMSGSGNVMGSTNGTKLKITAGGTVGFWSDTKGWLVCAASGTLTLSP